jgi:hypothetical protein
MKVFNLGAKVREANGNLKIVGLFLGLKLKFIPLWHLQIFDWRYKPR